MLQVAHLEKLFPGKDVEAPVRTTESVWNPSDKSVIMVRLYKSLPAWLDMESALGLGWTGWVPKSSGASFSLITAANCQHYPALPFSFAPHRQCHFQKCLLDRLQFVTMADERPFAGSFQLLPCCCCHSWLLLAWVCVAFVHPFIPLTKPHSWGLWLDTTGGWRWLNGRPSLALTQLLLAGSQQPLWSRYIFAFTSVAGFPQEWFGSLHLGSQRGDVLWAELRALDRGQAPVGNAGVKAGLLLAPLPNQGKNLPAVWFWVTAVIHV